MVRLFMELKNLNYCHCFLILDSLYHY